MYENNYGNGKILTLSEVTGNIQRVLAEHFSNTFWIRAEMNKLNLYPQSGHCYPDLVEKSGGKIIAEMRSNIWKDDYVRINTNFLNLLHEPLKDGISILFTAKVNFHPVYGLSLRIIDIDPSYSLGELEKEKRESIEKLKKEGIFFRNRSLEAPVLPKRIAVISASTSNGFSDFLNVIEDNAWGYKIFHMLFSAYLQGENAVESIIAQLGRIERVKDHFDAVAIIRGGGGDIGLSCYNNYRLSRAIAVFPLPVFTGIGHSTNETVAEMVAFRNAITPTDLADHLIQQFHNFSVPLQKAKETILSKFPLLIKEEKTRMLNVIRLFKSATLAGLVNRKSVVQHQARALLLHTGTFIERKKEREIKLNLFLLRQASGQTVFTARREMSFIKTELSHKTVSLIGKEWKSIGNTARIIDLMDPLNVLKRGYSITSSGGRSVRSINEVEKGARLKTILGDGVIISVTESVNKSETI